MKKPASLEKSAPSQMGKRQLTPAAAEDKFSSDAVKLTPSRKIAVESSPRPARASSKGSRKVAVQFSVHQPEAREVYVAGDFNAWDPRAHGMSKQGDGTWLLEMNLAPGDYEYRLVVDSEWRMDPTAARQTMNPYGGINAILTVVSG